MVATGPAAVEPAPRSVSLAPILAVNFVASLGFSIVLPFLIFLVERWGGNAVVYGILGATYSSFQLVGAPILGRWSDRYGRRRILLLSQLGTLASWLLFAGAFFVAVTPLARVDSQLLGRFTLTLPLLLLFIARATDGLTGGNISVANAYLGDVSTDETRNRNFGRMAVSANLGFIIGPALAGVLGATMMGELLPVLAAVLVSIIATIIIVFLLPESMRSGPGPMSPSRTVRKLIGQEQRECFEPDARTAAPTVREALSEPRIRMLLAIYFLVMLGFNFFYVGFPVQAVTRLGWTVVETGIFFSVLSFFMVVVQGPVLSRASRRFADETLMIAGGAVLTLAFLCFTAMSVPVLYVGAALIALGNGLMWSSVLSVLSRAAGAKRQGVVQGFASSAGAVASIIGLVAGGAIYSLVGARLFMLSAVVIAAACVLAGLLRSGRAGGAGGVDDA